MNEKLIQIDWEIDILGKLQKIHFHAEKSEVDIPLKIIDIVNTEFLNYEFNTILPEDVLARKVLSSQTLLYLLRGLLFVHKRMGIIQNPIESLDGAADPIQELLETQYLFDSTLYDMLLEGGNDITTSMEKYGYSFSEVENQLDIFLKGFSEDIRRCYKRLHTGVHKQQNKDKLNKQAKSWRAFMNSKPEINVPMSAEAKNKYLKQCETKKKIFEDQEIQESGLFGAVRLSVKNLIDVKLASTALGNAFYCHIRSSKKLLELFLKCPLCFEKNGKAYKAMGHNRYLPAEMPVLTILLENLQD